MKVFVIQQEPLQMDLILYRIAQIAPIEAYEAKNCTTSYITISVEPKNASTKWRKLTQSLCWWIFNRQ